MANNPKHILVIRLSAMGDVAMTVPVLQLFCQRYPNVKVTVLTKPFFAPIFKPLKGVTVVTAHIKDKHKGLLGLWKLYKELKALQIDAVADFHNVIRSRVLRFYFGLSGIVSCSIDKGRLEKKELTRAQNKIFKPLKSTHQRYADVLMQLGFPVQLQPIKPYRIPINASIINVLKTNPSQNSKPLIGIAPFAAHSGKQYPFELMTRVIDSLSKLEAFSILLFGGPSDAPQLKTIEKNYANVISIATHLSFEDEIILISNLDVMVSMDSGNGHLAAMFGCPVITLWGVTHPYAGFVPYNQPEKHQLLPDLKTYPKIPTSIYGNTVPDGYESVMETISVETVVKSITELCLP